ncbi:MAG TPA: hypothetical protein VF103_13570 [Polyangiaceae bacterium]
MGRSGRRAVGVDSAGRVGTVLLALVLVACAGKSSQHAKTRTAGGAGGGGEAGAGGAGSRPRDLPELTLEPTGEITLAGLTEPAEDIYVGEDGIFIVTLEQYHRFDFEGVALFDPGEGNRQRAGAGADAFRTNWFATVQGAVVVWYDFELAFNQLDGAKSSVGLAVDMDEAGSFQRLYVADAGLSSMREYTTQGALLRELAVPAVDLEGLAFSAAHRLFALDARSRELVRASEDFSKIDAFARLPGVIGTPSGIHWFDARLYVCFRDRDHIATFRLDEGS